MGNKIQTNITEVKVNAPTYRDVTFKPTLINFFYGKNGTGKSTLAKAFVDGNADITTMNGEIIPKERIFVYNEEFIKNNIQSYGNIPGVFTISEINAEKKKEADEKTIKRNELLNKASAADAEAQNINTTHTAAEEEYRSKLWEKTKNTRKKYPETQTGVKKDIKKFVDALVGKTVSDATDEECESLYKTVYGVEKPSYDEYHTINILPISELMETPIISRSTTDFARFIRALGNMDWVTAGHQYNSDGKCPYCQQVLPSDFEEKLASCYDEKYKRDNQELMNFIEAYEHMLTAVEASIEANLNNPFPTKLKENYRTQAQLLTTSIKRNRDLINKKKANPADEVTLEDLAVLVEKINSLTSSINEEVCAYMAVLADIPGQKKKCCDMVWGMMARECKDDIDAWNKRTLDDRVAWRKQHEDAKALKEQAQKLDEEITLLNSQTVNTNKAMRDINRLIASAGFVGFKLREKADAKYVYELVRDGRDIAHDLSEGERHFIAFLYFYHTVMGSQSDDGKQKKKIVIIDDPVSSMDSSSLFMVASLTREMIAVCYNNYVLDGELKDDHIKQFFCMTHNPYFFREVSFNHLKDFECVSFFEIKKNERNETSINICEDTDNSPLRNTINRSPVKNTYDALWDEYLHTNNPQTLMIVIRQILEYYFVQMVGYQIEDLRTNLENNSDFSKGDLTIARAMVAMIDVGNGGFNDGLYYDPSAVSLEGLRNIFKEIFKALKHEQHFNAMTGK